MRDAQATVDAATRRVVEIGRPEGRLSTKVGAEEMRLALAGLTAELTVDFALSRGVGDADAALEPAIEFLREQGRERAELHRVAAMKPEGRA